MVTTGHLVNTYFGLSTDAKPTKYVHNGSVFIEMDKGKCYLYDEESKGWIAQPSSGGGEDEG